MHRAVAASTLRSARRVSHGVSMLPRVATTSGHYSAMLHTTTQQAEDEKRGFLSRLNPFARSKTETTPAQTSASTATSAATSQEDLNVEIEEEEEEVIPSWKAERQSLSVEELESAVRSAAAPFLDTAPEIRLNKILLNNPKAKFEVKKNKKKNDYTNSGKNRAVLKACAISTGQEVPSKELVSIHNLQDLVTVLQRLDAELTAASPNPNGHVVAEWFQKNKDSLPSNVVFIPYQKSKGIKVEDRKSTNKRFL
ncbi:hypothetical protein BGW38_009840 [Lunasporangiospora selenospora]|uniref:Uncharacterized protein n=1 Tax=Lunasporangiospora selenospora TaxID=979761 RepID=A0A9P6G244_9FUNG|nr:hypothetical protein BGW38_009840 [Lunasporangiospora selenospora]